MTTGTIELLLATIALLALSIAVIIVFYSSALRKQQALQIKLRHIDENHAGEIETVHKEIYLQTLDEVSKDLHDNFGHILSLINMNLAMVLPQTSGSKEIYDTIAETKNLNRQLITDLKDMTKSLSRNYRRNFDLIAGMENEINRLNKSGLLIAQMTVQGIPVKADYKTELIVFRMFQEMLNNIIAHAKAGNCRVELEYFPTFFQLNISDDGLGFNYEEYLSSKTIRKGLGLKNMENRCALLGATFSMSSQPGKGTSISIKIRF